MHVIESCSDGFCCSSFHPDKSRYMVACQTRRAIFAWVSVASCMRQGDQRFDGVPDQVLEEQVIPCLVM